MALNAAQMTVHLGVGRGVFGKFMKEVAPGYFHREGQVYRLDDEDLGKLEADFAVWKAARKAKNDEATRIRAQAFRAAEVSAAWLAKAKVVTDRRALRVAETQAHIMHAAWLRRNRE